MYLSNIARNYKYWVHKNILNNVDTVSVNEFLKVNILLISWSYKMGVNTESY